MRRKPIDALRAMDTQISLTICTLMNDVRQYEELRLSLEQKGFLTDATELMVVDNSQGNVLDAFEAVNTFLQAARGEHILICHQDIVVLEDFSALKARIAELDALDPCWAVAGNAGTRLDQKPAIRITDPSVENGSVGGPFPVRVSCLDENFIILKRRANLAVSGDLQGYHFYGLDICLVADVLGYTSYVIDFHVRHKSPGHLDENFHGARRRIIAKYHKAFRTRWLYSPTRSSLPLSGSRLYVGAFKIMRGIRVRLLRRDGANASFDG